MALMIWRLMGRCTPQRGTVREGQRSTGQERGSNLLETALVIPLLLILLAGAVDVGRVFTVYLILTNATREGARYASHFPHYAEGTRQTVRQEVGGTGIDLQDTDIVIEPEAPDGALPSDPAVAQPGETIVVWVEYEMPTLLTGAIGLDRINVRTGTHMIVFGQDV
jgi:hypothetical protein